MKQVKVYFSKILNLFLCFLMLAINLIPLSTFDVYAIDSNINGVYGIVYFRTKGCSTNTKYTVDGNSREGYTNGCYGADGAFLGYNSDKTKVKFKLAGVTGWVNTSDVKVIDYMSKFDSLYTSNYYVKDGILKHNIMSDVYSYSSGDSVSLGPKPSFMTEGSYYWSYDGHYFYSATKDGYKKMIDDYVNNRTTDAINNGNPYYNYYQYLTHRTQSNYTNKDIANYFKSIGITSLMTSYPASNGQSLLYGEDISFVQYQNEFGANLGLVLGLAQNESAAGTSNIAFYGKNLFGHSAFDSSPGASATSYLSVAQSIYAHDKFYVSEGYLDPCDQTNLYGGSYNYSKCHKGRYYGGHVGDKNSGLNVKYASDPYWGDKAAQYYYLMDSALGMQDYNKYTIAVKTNGTSIPIYKEAKNTSTKLYETGLISDYPVVVLAEVTGQSINGNNKWYKIQTDPVLDSGRNKIIQDSGYYKFSNNYAYVHSSNFIKVNTGKTIKNNYSITFNPNGGVFSDGVTANKVLSVEQNVIPVINDPTKEGDTFLGWSPTIMGASGDITYVAKWKNSVEKYDITFDPDGGTFSDGTTKNKVVTVNEGDTPSISDPTKEGYIFKGWSPSVSSATKNITYIATWEKKIVYYDIIFDANGGKFADGSSTISKKVEDGVEPKVDAPTREGYIFKGWSPDIVNSTKNTVYTAIWEKEVYYDITFDANGGKFSNDKNEVIIKTIKGSIPTVELPTKKGYLFTGWEPELVEANESKTYKANWKKGVIEDTLTKKDGEFYLNELKWNSSTKKYDVSGYLIMLGVNNKKTDQINYDIVLRDKNNDNEYFVHVDHWTNNLPFDLGSENGKDYSGAWFKGSVNFDDIPQGDYNVYMRAYNNTYYTKTVFSNLFNKSIIRRGETDKKGTSFMVELGKVNKQLSLEIRDEGLITTKESSTFRNMTNDYDDMSFTGNLLKVVGTSYNYGGNYKDGSKITRHLILENVDTFERFIYDIGSTKNGSYKVSIGDNISKDYAWYNKSIDVTKMPKGTYRFVVYTKTLNSEDYGEVTDKFAAINKAKLTKNGITYEVILNKDRNNRIELKVY